MIVHYRLRPVVLVGILVAACAPSGVSPSTSAAPTTTVPGLAVPKAPEPTTARVPAETTGPPEVTATTPVSVPLATDEEIAALLPSTPVTTAPPGAVRASILERQKLVLECMRRYGFDGEIDERDLGINFGKIPDEQFDRFLEVGEICRKEEFERYGLTLGVPTREELEASYRMNLYVRECMIMEGYPVSQPPSLEAYIESLGAIWHPYDAFVESGQGGVFGFSELQETCPQDGFYLRTVLDLDSGP